MSGSSAKKPARKDNSTPGKIPAKVGAGAAREIPWLTIGAAVFVIALIVVLAVNMVPKYLSKQAQAAWAPTAELPDPSVNIEGVAMREFDGGIHVQPAERVAYDATPPMGGPHDSIWANCNGTVYPVAIRTENAVHGLEHGAVWITYNPETAADADIDALAAKVSGNSYMMMSPYPGQPTPISLQSWGHQLQLDDAADTRIDQFISALRLNSNTYPEVGATCSTTPSVFDVGNPPLFDPTAPGPDAIPIDGGGIAKATEEMPTDGDMAQMNAPETTAPAE
jgi:hypothetical protein